LSDGLFALAPPRSRIAHVLRSSAQLAPLVAPARRRELVSIERAM